MKTAKEFLKTYKVECGETYCSGMCLSRKEVEKMMEKYASQFHPSPKEISEEEIEKILKEEVYIEQSGYLNGNADLMGIKDASIAIVKALSLPSSGSKTEDCSVEFWFYVKENYDEKDLLFYLKEGKDKKGKSLPLVHQLFLKDKQK